MLKHEYGDYRDGMTRELVPIVGAGEETIEMIEATRRAINRREGLGAYRRRNELLLELVPRNERSEWTETATLAIMDGRKQTGNNRYFSTGISQFPKAPPSRPIHLGSSQSPHPPWPLGLSARRR